MKGLKIKVTQHAWELLNSENNWAGREVSVPIVFLHARPGNLVRSSRNKRPRWSGLRKSKESRTQRRIPANGGHR